MILEGFVCVVATLVSSLLGYAYHFAMTRLLAPEDYGNLGVLLGLFMIATAPTVSLERAVAREVAKLDAQKKSAEIAFVVRKYVKLGFTVGLILGLSVYLLSYAVGWVYSQDTLVFPVQLMAVMIPFWYVAMVLTGFLQGMEKVWALSFVTVIQPAVKLAGGVILVLAGLGLVGAAFPATLGALFVIPFVWFLCKSSLEDAREYEITLRKSVGLFLATDLVLSVILYLDLFYVRYFMSASDAGYYNVASVTAKVLLYATWGVLLIFLPKASKLTLESRRAFSSLLWRGTALILPVALVFMVFPAQVISVFYTKSYLPAASSFRLLSFGLLVFGVYNLVLNVMWSQREEKIPLYGAVLSLAVDAMMLYYLVPKMGLLGAALSTTLASIMLLIPPLVWFKIKTRNN